MTRPGIVVQILGTSADIYAFPHREPLHLVVTTPSNCILLDCPPSVTLQLMRAQIPWRDIDTILVSHLHMGHCLGIPFLVYLYASMHREHELTIIGPPGLRAFVDSVLSHTTTLPKELKERPYPLSILELEAEDPASFDLNASIRIRSAPLKHTKLNLGYRLELDYGRPVTIVYSGDTAPCANLITLAEEADLLVMDCTFEHNTNQLHAPGEIWEDADMTVVEYCGFRGHTTAKQAGEVARMARVKKLVLTHLHGTRAREEYSVIRRMLEEARSEFEGDVLFPNDLNIVGAY